MYTTEIFCCCCFFFFYIIFNLVNNNTHTANRLCVHGDMGSIERVGIDASRNILRFAILLRSSNSKIERKKLNGKIVIEIYVTKFFLKKNCSFVNKKRSVCFFYLGQPDFRGFIESLSCRGAVCVCNFIWSNTFRHFPKMICPNTPHSLLFPLLRWIRGKKKLKKKKKE